MCSADTRIVNSRLQKRINHVWRRRQCTYCHTIFTTTELTDYSLFWLVKNNAGSMHPFVRDKLFLSIYNSCRHRKEAITDSSDITNTIINKLTSANTDPLINKQSIIETATVTLNRFDKIASSHYQAFHK